MIDPRDRDEMMVLAVGRALLREFYLAGLIEVVDFSNDLPVGRNDVHVFLDLRLKRHLKLRKSLIATQQAAEGCTPTGETGRD
jgi:hypothetical protein